MGGGITEGTLPDWETMESLSDQLRAFRSMGTWTQADQSPVADRGCAVGFRRRDRMGIDETIARIKFTRSHKESFDFR